MRLTPFLSLSEGDYHRLHALEQGKVFLLSQVSSSSQGSNPSNRDIGIEIPEVGMPGDQ